MKFAHNIKIKVFCKENEDENKVKKALLSLIPFDLIKEKVELRRCTALGFNNKKIMIFEINLKKTRHTNSFLNALVKRLTQEQKDLLLRELNFRIDDNLNFFLRFDKYKLIEKGVLWITNKGNCFHIKISVAAFPAKKEKALEVIKELLS